MIHICLCHSAADRADAQRLASQLELLAEARVILDEADISAEETVADRWESGESCHAVLLLLSETSVPARADRSSWESLIRHFEENGEPPVGFLKLRECRIPALLQRTRYFSRLRETLPWLISLHPKPSGERFRPMAVEQRCDDSLWTLVDSAAIHNTTHEEASALAHAAHRYFRDVVFVDEHEPEHIVGELAARIGMRLECDAEEAARRVGRALDDHRILVVLRAAAIPFPRAADARSSILLTPPTPAERANQPWPEERRFAWERFRTLRAAGRWPEAVLVLRKARDSARLHGDTEAVDEFSWELSWLGAEGSAGLRRTLEVPPQQLGLF